MKEHEISTPDDLDVALSANLLRKHSQLWKVAEGRSFRWTEALGLAIAVLLVAVGIARFSEEASGTIQIAIGLALVASFIWSHMQRQLNALVELVKRLEDKRS